MPTLHEVLESYKRSLLAHVQLQEFRSWGGGTSGAFNQEIAGHVQIERAYLAELLEERRRASTPRERGDTTRFGMPVTSQRSGSR
jgi:hypothetical protein